MTSPLIFRRALLSVFVFIWLVAQPTRAVAQKTVDDFGSSVISMDFQNVDLKNVLKILSQQSGLNFVSSAEVQDKKISLYLNEVTVQDALDNIIRANDLRYERERGSGIFVVYPSKIKSNELTTKVFKVRHTRLSSSALDVGGQSVIRDLAIRNERLSQGEEDFSVPIPVGLAGLQGEDLYNVRGIDKVMETLLSSKGKVTADLRTNSLIVTDFPRNLELVEEDLRRLDVPPSQVMIEVEILEVKASIFEDVGLEWGGTDGALFSFMGGSRSAAFPFQETLFGNFNSAARAKSSITLGTLSANDFKATLHFLVNQQDTKILARPRILTVNNEAAIIKLVTNTAIAKVSTQTASEGVSVTTSDTAERTQTGIVLKLTPQINEDRSVELFLEPSVTTVSTSTFFSSDFLDPTTRSVRTTVRVNDNETLVIGGLIDTDEFVSEKKIPFLGDLPIVGQAFRYKNRDNNDRELIVFITPHVVDNLLSPQKLDISTFGRTEQMTRFLHQTEMRHSIREGEMKRTLDLLGRSTKG